MIALLFALAFAGECALTAPPAHVSVAWISPVGAHARGGRWLWVTPTAHATDGAPPPATPGDFLRHLGLRSRRGEPRRRYKVVVFDAASETLCRPIDGLTAGSEVTGAAVCDDGVSRETGFSDACAQSPGGAQWYRARWRDIAVDGFCVLPLDRFLEQARR